MFIKIENDGYGLGAQRREIDKNDLPQALEIIKKYKIALKEDRYFELNNDEEKLAHLAAKEKIAESGDYNLSGDRYKEFDHITNQKWSMIGLEEICSLQRGLSYSSSELGKEDDGVPLYNLKSIKKDGNLHQHDFKYYKGQIKDKHYVKQNDILIALTDLTPTSEIIGSPKIIIDDIEACYSADLAKVIITDLKRIDPHFLYQLLKSKNYRNHIVNYSHGANVKHLQVEGFYSYKIPLPPLEVQKEIIEQIEVKQQAIEHAKAIIKNLEREYFGPSLRKLENIEWVELSKLSTIVRGSSPRPQGDKRYYGGSIPRLMVADVTRDGMYTIPKIDFLTKKGARLSRPMKKGDLIMAVSGQPGLCTILNVDACIHDGFVGFRNLDNTKVLTEFAYYILMTMRQDNNSFSIGAVFKNLNTDQIKEFKIPIPPLEIQKQLVVEAEREEEIATANHRLIELMEQKIEDVLNQI